MGLFVKPPGCTCALLSSSSSSLPSWCVQPGSTILPFSPPKMIFLHLVMASPSRDVLSSLSPCYSLPLLHHHICRLPSGFPCRLYCSSGRGWLIRRQLHLTVSGSCSDGFSTAIDKMLPLVLNACYKRSCPALPAHVDLLGCTLLSPPLHCHLRNLPPHLHSQGCIINWVVELIQVKNIPDIL